MKFGLIILCIGVLFESSAHCGNLELRKGLNVNWPESLAYSVNYMGQDAGYWLTDKSQSGTDHQTVVQTTSLIPVNAAIAKAEWKQFLQNEKKLDITSTDKGCEEQQKHWLACARTAVTPTKRFIAEKHVWTPKNDRVMLRATSEVSEEKAEAALQTLELKMEGNKP